MSCTGAVSELSRWSDFLHLCQLWPELTSQKTLLEPFQFLLVDFLDHITLVGH